MSLIQSPTRSLDRNPINKEEEEEEEEYDAMMV